MRRIKRVQEENTISLLTVDDDEVMTAALQAYFKRAGYCVDVENNPLQAIEKIRQGSYDIVLLDFLMSPICGDKVIEEVRKFNKGIYIILLTGHKSMAPPLKTMRELDIQGYYEKSDRLDQLELLVESCVKSIRQIKMIRDYQNKLKQTYKALNDSYDEMISMIRTLVDARDVYTRGHSDRVSKLAAKIALKMCMDKEEIKKIRLAGMFHDIGKIGIPDEVLLKPEKLSFEEYKIIQKHCEIGEKILLNTSVFHEIAPIVRSHHEKIDGSGYPDGIRGEEIPIEARIIAVADAFDAMTSERQYRNSKSVSEAIQEIVKCRGSQFDVNVIDSFLELTDDIGINDLDKYFI